MPVVSGADALNLSGKNAALGRRCVALRRQLSVERQKRSISTSESEFRIQRLSRERDALKQDIFSGAEGLKLALASVAASCRN